MVASLGGPEFEFVSVTSGFFIGPILVNRVSRANYSRDLPHIYSSVELIFLPSKTGLVTPKTPVRSLQYRRREHERDPDMVFTDHERRALFGMRAEM